VSLQTIEKLSANFKLDVTNSGGHSAVPRKDNAIYRLAEGLLRLSKFEFPLHLNETTRVYFERIAESETEQTAADIRSMLSDNPDPAALGRLSTHPGYNSQLRTTCVATLLQAGQAINALPQFAQAQVNCRIMPGETVDEVKANLVRVLADDQIKLTPTDQGAPSEPSKLSEEVVGAIEKLSREYWPGAVLVPVMSSGATDGSYLRNAGIATYGHSGLANDVNDSRAHGRDERIPIKSFYEGDEYLYRLVKALSGGT
jgi:acetylornithine deacetylase/succinyl-diaminopimelate desuccinylase-like protein